MRGTLTGVVLLVLVTAIAGEGCAQPPRFPEGVWVELGGPEEPQGLRFKDQPSVEETSRIAEMGGRPCRATDVENGLYSFWFTTVPEFMIPGVDAISVTVEYFDNGTSSIYLQYPSHPPGGAVVYRSAPPVARTNTRQWKTATWQIVDPGFADPATGSIELGFNGEGWFGGDCELYFASVRVTHEVIRLEADPPVVPADGATTSRVSVLALNAGGDPVDDGSVVTIECDGAAAPPAVTTTGGQAEFTVTAGAEPQTVWITATCGGVARQCWIYQVAGEAPLQTFTRTYGADVLRDHLSLAGREAEDLAITDPAQQADPGVAELHLAFPEGLERARALVSIHDLPVPGKPTKLRLELGSNGGITQINVLLVDTAGRQFLYGVVDTPDGFNGWRTVEINADYIGACYGDKLDFAPQLPLRWQLLSLHFKPGTTDGVVYVRTLESECIGSQAEAEQATGPILGPAFPATPQGPATPR